jgi:RimJ/RimL family protein N-acetyltransferase
MQAHIRDARRGDAAVLCEAERVIVRSFDGLLVSEPDELSEGGFVERIDMQSGGRTKVLVAESAGELVGHASLYPMGLRKVTHVLRLEMCVHLGHWGRGHGTRLLAALLEWARQGPQAHKIELLVRSTNLAAIALYERAAFVQEGRFKDRVRLRDGRFIDDLGMGLVLREHVPEPLHRADVSPMNIRLRHATSADASAISALVCAGFSQHIAQDWQLQAQRHFFEENQADKLRSKLADAALCLLCEQETQLLGVIFLPRPSLVQLFFVAPGHLRNGIGRKLWSAVRVELEQHHPEVKTVELNSSPYAVSVYKALGFFPISKPYRRNGAVATRMACWLPGDSLESAEDVA